MSRNKTIIEKDRKIAKLEIALENQKHVENEKFKVNLEM
jgi:hypothetical protein